MLYQLSYRGPKQTRIIRIFPSGLNPQSHLFASFMCAGPSVDQFEGFLGWALTHLAALNPFRLFGRCHAGFREPFLKGKGVGAACVVETPDRYVAGLTCGECACVGEILPGG